MSWLLDDAVVDRLIECDANEVATTMAAVRKPRAERYACGKRKASAGSVPWQDHEHLKRKMDECGARFVRTPPSDDDPNMNLATAERIAAEEGFYILRSPYSKTGFHGVRKKFNAEKPVFIAYAARGHPSDRSVSLGTYTTLAQAALVASRSLFQRSAKNALAPPNLVSARLETAEEASEAAGEVVYSSVVVELDD